MKNNTLKEAFFDHFARNIQPNTETAKRSEKISVFTMFLFSVLAISFSICILILFVAYQQNVSEIHFMEEVTKNMTSSKKNTSKNVEGIRRTLNAVEKNWASLLYNFSLSNSQINKLLENKLITTTKNSCAPSLLYLSHERVQTYLSKGKWDDLLSAFRVYLMLHNKESFDIKLVSQWFYEHKDSLQQLTSTTDKEIKYILDNMSPKMFSNARIDGNLCAKIIATVQSPTLSQSVYNMIVHNLSKQPPIKVIDCIPKGMTYLLHPSITEAQMPYLYTKEGYKALKTWKKKIVNSLVGISYLENALDISVVQTALEDMEEIYKDNYENQWFSLLAKIRIKPTSNIRDFLKFSKTLSAELSTIFLLITQLEKKILIQDNSHLSNVISDVTSNILAKKDIEIEALKPEKFIQYTPLQREEAHAIKAKIQENLQEIISYSASIVSANDPNLACHRIFSAIQQEDSAIRKGETLANTLPTPIDAIYADFISGLEHLLHKHSAEHVNSVWDKKIRSYYIKHLAKKYPFCSANYNDQVNLAYFKEFFAEGGHLSTFKQEYVDKGLHLLSPDAIKAMKFFENIQNHWFAKDEQLKVAFSVTHVTIEPKVKKVAVSMCGKTTHVTHSNPGPNEFIWEDPTVDIAKVVFSTRSSPSTSIVYVGPWSWYKLLQLDHVGKSTPGKAIRRTFLSPGGEEMNFSLHFSTEFFSLCADKIKIPKEIVMTQNYHLKLE
ncbi:ImcF-related family protein [Candidatus Sneabacter namystus]|uniref:IcmF-related domain-containing protein n=1 Tax=Candidatus Sneabacter namystus TaxID=2601646 RepID=A0A5C0UKD8_9RICK|nr:ImcF-related family protein [Candidatus Sneabacter namystus]QEK39902.1 hypothetical protein FZC37_03065 [Candidatus Sneabacter namystus]